MKASTVLVFAAVLVAACHAQSLLPVPEQVDGEFNRCSTVSQNDAEVFLNNNCRANEAPGVLCSKDCFEAQYFIANCQVLAGLRSECQDLVSSTRSFCANQAPGSFGAGVNSNNFDCSTASGLLSPWNTFFACFVAIIVLSGVQMLYA